MLSISSMGFTLFGGGFFAGFGGPPGSAGGTSSCGKEFDAYVKRTLEPFPYEPNMPASRVTEMWTGRKAKIYSSPTQYKIATVERWVQSNSGPFSPSTQWRLTLKFDDGNDNDNDGSSSSSAPAMHFVKGDQVKICGKPKKFDGQDGTVISVHSSSGKVKVQLDDDMMVFVNVGAEHLKSQRQKLNTRTGRQEYSVRRMNITGGGILDEIVPTTPSDLIPSERRKVSLEWIDEPSPPVPSDLFPNTVNVKCPTCRAVEPNDVAFDDTIELHIEPEACPICTDTKLPSRTLRCGHTLCNDCFRQWRDRGNSKIPSSVQQPYKDPTSLQRDRDRAFQRLRSTLPHTFLNGTATRANCRTRQSNNQPRIDQAISDFRIQVGRILIQLDELAHPCIHRPTTTTMIIDGDQSLIKYWAMLREISVHIFCEKTILEEFLNDLQNMAAVEILMKVTEERKDAIAEGMITFGLADDESKPSSEQDPVDQQKWAEGYVEHCFSQYCNRIGELYEDDGNSRSAIYWYERAVLHSRKALKLQNDSAQCKALLSMLYNNLGVAQRRAGLLTDAMNAYDQSIALHPEDDTAHNNKQRLQAELDEWTGSSGKLTPP